MHLAQMEKIRQQRQSVLVGLTAVRVTLGEHYQRVEHGMSVEELQTFVEIMLRIARVPVVMLDQASDEPRVHVTLNAVRIADTYSAFAMVEVLDRVWLVRPNQQNALEAAVWRACASFAASPSE